MVHIRVGGIRCGRRDLGHLALAAGLSDHAFFVVALGELSELVESKVLHLEAPLDAVEGVVSEGWRQKLEVGPGSEDLEQVVSHPPEGVVVVVGLVAGVPAHELDGREAAASQEPAPKVVEEEAEAQQGVEGDEEAHEFVVVLVDVVIPNADDGDDHVARAYPRVQDEQQEESLVLKSNAIVREDAVVAHLEHT